MLFDFIAFGGYHTIEIICNVEEIMELQGLLKEIEGRLQHMWRYL